MLPLKATGENPFLPPQASGICLQSLVFFGLYMHHSSHMTILFLVYLHIFFPLCMSVSVFKVSLFIRTLVMTD